MPLAAVVLTGCFLYPQEDPDVLTRSYTEALEDYRATGSSSSLCTAARLVGSRSSRALGPVKERKRLFIQYALEAADIDVADGIDIEQSQCASRLRSALYTKKGDIISPDREMESCFGEDPALPPSERFELCAKRTGYKP